MSTQISNLQQTRNLKRTQYEKNLSSINLDSSSSEIDAHDKRHHKRTKNSSGRPATKNSSVGILDDFQKFSKSLIEDFKLESQKMLAQFKKDMRNVAATNSTMMTTKGKGVLALTTDQPSKRAIVNATNSTMMTRKDKGKGVLIRRTCSQAVLTTDQFLKRSTVSATNSTMITRKDRGKGVLIRQTCTQALKTDHSSKKPIVSGPQYDQHKATTTRLDACACLKFGRASSVAPNAVQQYYYEQHMINSAASRNVIPPPGHDAYRRCYNYGRNSSAPNAVHRPGYFTNLLAHVTGSGNAPFLHQNSVQTSGIGSSFPRLSLQQRWPSCFW